MLLRPLVGIVAVLIAPGSPLFRVEPDSKQIKQVQDEVRELRENAFRVMSDAEFEKFSRLIHPQLVSQARFKHTSETRKKLSDLFKVEKVEFPAPPRFFSAAEHEFVYVPYSMTVLRGGYDRKKDTGYCLGGRKRGTTAWVYIDGPQLALGQASSYFPDFPKNVEPPPISSVQLK